VSDGGAGRLCLHHPSILILLATVYELREIAEQVGEAVEALEFYSVTAVFEEALGSLVG
jgi:hypothetical protein